MKLCVCMWKSGFDNGELSDKHIGVSVAGTVPMEEEQ